MIAGRKGKTIEFTISFDRSDFHHLSGLHKLKGNARIQTGQREAVMLDVLAGKITLPQIQKSAFYGEMEPRLRPLSMLEQFLDSNDIIFRYNAKAHAFSLIQADYLLQNDFEGNPVYLSLPKGTTTIRRFAAHFSRSPVQTMPKGSRATRCCAKKNGILKTGILSFSMTG